MKRSLLLLATAFCLSGCGAKSYEQQAGLTPLAAPVAVSGAVVVPYPTPLPTSSANGSLEMASVESAVASAATPAAANAIVTEAQASLSMMSQLEGSIGGQHDQYKAQRQQYFKEIIGYVERAAVIKRHQLEAGEQNDSTGEVAKYLNYSRISIANGNTLPPIAR